MNKAILNFDSNNKTKKNHIVPQVYLRYFKKSDQNDINVYDKRIDEIYTSNISNLCSENKLYVIEDNSTDVYMSWEDYYTKNVDNTINSVFNEIIKNAECTINIKPLLDYELRLKIINIISHQMLRTHEKIYSFYDDYPKELDELLMDKLPGHLNIEQKKRKIKYLVNENLAKKENQIENIGTNAKPIWVLKK